MNFKVGDKVVVISGKDKGKEGTITHVLKLENRVVVEGVTVMEVPVVPLLQVLDVPPLTVRFTVSPAQMVVSRLMVVLT